MSETSKPGEDPERLDPQDPGRSDQVPVDHDGPGVTVEDQLRQHGVRIGRGGISPAVFWPSLILVASVSIIAIVFPDATGAVLSAIQGGIVESLGWYYMIAVALFIVFVAFVGFSRFGEIRLGKDDEPPEYGVWSWFAMLFAAGMGIGLVFFGVAEPLILSTTDPKPGTEGSPADLALLGTAQTFVHWGLHPWAVYGVIGLSLAYAIHRRGRPVSIRWALEPLLGDRVKGGVGDVIDILAIVGTLFGVATSLGLGVQQIASGLAVMGVLAEPSNAILVVLIVVITFIATLSVVTGIGRGIKWLSNINLSMAGVLLVSVLLLGPTLFLFRDFAESFGVYLANVLNMTFDAAAYTGEEGQRWLADWTIFYWGWWISWAPFVGVFIARISRGRTVRQFIAGVLGVPALLGFVWFTVLGGTAIHRQLFGAGDLVEPGGEVVAEQALFDMLAGLPFGAALSVLAIILVAIFFITSSDSGSLVVTMLSHGGHPDPSQWSRLLWASLEGLVAIGLLLAGGLAALQAGAIATALPFSVVLLVMCAATYKALRAEHRIVVAAELRMRQREFTGKLSEHFDEHFGEQVDERIDYALRTDRGVWSVVERRRTQSRRRQRRLGGDRGSGADGTP